nr:hypothetical protein CFP56_74754 [Quercus suber]
MEGLLKRGRPLGGGRAWRRGGECWQCGDDDCDCWHHGGGGGDVDCCCSDDDVCDCGREVLVVLRCFWEHGAVGSSLPPSFLCPPSPPPSLSSLSLSSLLRRSC